MKQQKNRSEAIRRALDLQLAALDLIEYSAEAEVSEELLSIARCAMEIATREIREQSKQPVLEVEK